MSEESCHEEPVEECPYCSGKQKERSDSEYKDLMNRLKRIEGQVRGVEGMLENGAYCTDVLMQVSAIKSALNSFNKVLLGNHLRTCVAESIRAGDDDVIDELVNEVVVYNKGTAALKLSSVVISEGQSKSSNEMGFFVKDSPEPGVVIIPGSELALQIGCRNDKEYPSPLTGELLIVNTDPTEYGVNANKRVTLKCGPNVEKFPTAKLKCEPETVSVFQWAVLDGSESTDSDGVSKENLKYLWSFATTPGGISLDIVDDSNRAGSPLNGDPSNKINRAAFQAKIKGAYTVRLIVINDKGISSVPAECTVDAVSDDDLAIKMLWNNKNSDIDLHLIRPDGEFGNNQSDCYFWNCSPQYSGERPDWGVEGDTKDDPFLDIDNTDGIGPETVTINKPANGTYKVTVHAYDTSHGPSTVVVKGYAHGAEEQSASLLMSKTDTCWDVFTIEVGDGDGTKKSIKITEITPATVYDCSRPTH